MGKVLQHNRPRQLRHFWQPVTGALSTMIGTPARTTPYEHVHIDSRGRAIISGTNMKVIELVLAQIAYGWSPEELHYQHPYLTMGQIHSALAYYWDHRTELDKEIEQSIQFAEDARRKAGPSPLATRFRASGLLK